MVWCCTGTAIVGQSLLKPLIVTGGPNSGTQQPGAVITDDVTEAGYRAV